MVTHTGLELTGAILVSLLLVLLVSILFIKIYARLTCGVFKSSEKMSGKTVIITGANSGIGKETARELAKRGARVIMACRNLEAANRVKEEIVSESGNDNVVVRKLDLSSFESIREFAAEINKTEQKLDVLVHNAGVAYTFEKVVTKDGLDMTMGTNHFGPFLLTHLLIDLLKRSKPSRIVVVASCMYRFALGFNMSKVNPVRYWLPAILYFYSKYVNIVFTLELAKRLEGSGVTANCLHPGMIDTGIWRNVPCPLNICLYPVLKGIFKTPEEGCHTSVYCAVSEELEGKNGKYFSDCKEAGLADYIKDPAKGKKLWELSEKLVKLEPNDPRI
ncbi:UNVERIFIED_CONTAM: hypothetical protein PYX00_004855 [Menopon gallinae]|uniref:Retinol dehydrogenase 14 n=1 Tax=Menopon gallinae TaxID=328185 RepID=A0AAW2I855_9NEOP